MTLYTCEGSRGFRVSWTAAELGLPLAYKMLPFPPRLHQPDYLEVNPLGTVPMLVDGDIKLTESSAITLYLASRTPPNPLIVGPDEADYGCFLDFLHHADATLTFPLSVYLRFSLFERERGLAQAGEAYARWFGARLTKVERRLEGRSYLCAERFTLADIAVCYALWLAHIIGLRDFFGANVASYLSRQMARPSFAQAIALERAAAVGVSPSVREAIARLRSRVSPSDADIRNLEQPHG